MGLGRRRWSMAAHEETRMKDVLKIGALLGGAFLLWQVMTKKAQAAAAPAQPTAAAPAAAIEAAPASTVDVLNAAAARFGLPAAMSADQWGWVYAQVRGQQAPDPLGYLGSRDRSFLFSAAEWFAEALAPAGLSGLSRRAWRI